MKVRKVARLTPLQTLKLLDTLIRQAEERCDTSLQIRLINTEITYARSCIALGTLKDPNSKSQEVFLEASLNQKEEQHVVSGICNLRGAG
jgi:hypothetical protein